MNGAYSKNYFSKSKVYLYLSRMSRGDRRDDRPGGDDDLRRGEEDTHRQCGCDDLRDGTGRNPCPISPYKLQQLIG